MTWGIRGADPATAGVTSAPPVTGPFMRMGVPCVVFGAGSIGNAHTPDEFVSITQLERGVKVISALLRSEMLDGDGA